MELIDIIFRILVFSGLLLFIVILTSYLISRINKKENPQIEVIRQSKSLSTNKSLINFEQGVLRKGISQPMIFHVDQLKNRDIKIVKKQTMTYSDYQEAIRIKDPQVERKTQSKANRYTIINDQIKKDNKPFIVNF